MTTYYHAGPKGLSEILPPSVTGKRQVCASSNPDKVYLTSSLEMAIGIASLLPDKTGAVYECSPVNPSHDPDCETVGLSFEADRASIVRVVKVKGRHLKRARSLMMAGE